MNKKQYLIIIFNILLATFSLSYLFYRRFFKIRLPRDLIIFENNIFNYNLLIFLVISIFFCLANFFAVILFIKKIKKETIFTKLSEKLNTIVDDAF